MPPLKTIDRSDAGRPLWKSNQEWILLFDNLMKFPKGRRAGVPAASGTTTAGTAESMWQLFALDSEEKRGMIRHSKTAERNTFSG